MSARRRPSHWLRGPFLVGVGVFFVVPQLAMARFAFQNVPVVLLTAGTLGKGWSFKRFTEALAEPALWEAVRVSVLLAQVSEYPLDVVRLLNRLPIDLRLLEVLHSHIEPTEGNVCNRL